MAEMELSVFSRPCLDRRIPDESALEREVRPWNTNAIRPKSESTGNSPPGMPAASLNIYIHQFHAGMALVLSQPRNRKGKDGEAWFGRPGY